MSELKISAAVPPFTTAFPAETADDVRLASAVMPPSSYAPILPFTVTLADEPITIPSRIYYPEPAAAQVQALTSRQQVILSCLYTRHHDGYVRQRHLEQAIATAEPWTVPNEIWE